MVMETVFLSNEAERRNFLQRTMRSFACDYVCIWSYLPQPSNCLFFLDGVCRELSNRSSSSSLGRRLFEGYRGLLHNVDAGRIPGFAFKNKLTYMELTLHNVQRLVSNDLQLQFYQEAKIQNVVFMGCGAGEIELGFSKDPQANMEMEIRNLISSCFSHRFKSPVDGLPSMSSQPLFDQNQPISSSSPSIRSQISIDSLEQYSQVLLLNPQASLMDQELIQKQALIDNSIEFPAKEIEDSAVAKAILAVLSSSSSSPSANSSPSQSSLKPPTSAFSSYRSRMAGSSIRPIQARTTARSNNMFKRAVLFFRNLNAVRKQELLSGFQGNQATPTQLHHMISERRRREKLNESFQALRSLLPPGSKKDKATVLNTTTEYLSKLKSQVDELRRRNQELEDRVLNPSVKGYKDLGFSSLLSQERTTTVEISQVASTSTLPEERFLDLRVAVRGDVSMLDFVLGMLGFLKRRTDNVRLSSIECNEMMVDESYSMHGIVMRLKIEGGEFDESNFEEAVKKIVGELSSR